MMPPVWAKVAEGTAVRRAWVRLIWPDCSSVLAPTTSIGVGDDSAVRSRRAVPVTMTASTSPCSTTVWLWASTAKAAHRLAATAAALTPDSICFIYVPSFRTFARA